MIIDQLTPLLPKDNEEVNAQVKRLQVMLDAAIVVHPILERGDGVRGQDLDHRQSPCGDSTSSLTHPEQHYRGLVPKVLWATGYSPKFLIRSVPSSSKQLGNHTPHTGYGPTT
jgi:hypothetical protein